MGILSPVGQIKPVPHPEKVPSSLTNKQLFLSHPDNARRDVVFMDRRCSGELSILHNEADFPILDLPLSSVVDGSGLSPYSLSRLLPSLRPRIFSCFTRLTSVHFFSRWLVLWCHHCLWPTCNDYPANPHWLIHTHTHTHIEGESIFTKSVIHCCQ